MCLRRRFLAFENAGVGRGIFLRAGCQGGRRRGGDGGLMVGRGILLLMLRWRWSLRLMRLLAGSAFVIFQLGGKTNW